MKDHAAMQAWRLGSVGVRSWGRAPKEGGVDVEERRRPGEEDSCCVQADKTRDSVDYFFKNLVAVLGILAGLDDNDGCED